MAIKRLKVNGSWIEFLKCMRDGESFRTHGSLWGVAYPNGAKYVFPGRLEGEAYEEFSRINYGPGFSYIVFSYTTPIAWKVAGKPATTWQMPDDRYSVTTSKHQGRIAPGIGIMNDDKMNGTHIANTYK